MKRLYIDITYHSGKPLFLGGKIISEDPYLTIYSLTYAIDDNEPVSVDMTKAFILSAELIDALSAQNVVKISLHADVCAHLVYKLLEIPVRIDEWRDVSFFEYRMSLPLRDSNLEWLMNMPFRQVLEMKKYYEKTYLNRPEISNRPADNPQLWSLYISEQSKIVSAMRTFSERYMETMDYGFVWKEFQNHLIIRENEKQISMDVSDNTSSLTWKNMVKICNANKSFCNLHFKNIEPEAVLKSIKQAKDGGHFKLLYIPEAKERLQQYVKASVLLNEVFTGSTVNFEQSPLTTVYEACVYTCLTGTETRIGCIRILNRNNDLYLVLPSGTMSVLRISGFRTDDRKRMQLYTENSENGVIERRILGPNVVFDHFIRFVTHAIMVDLLDELLRADVMVCLDGKRFLVYKTYPEDETENKVENILLLLPNWIYKLDMVPEIKKGETSDEQLGA